MPHDCSDLMLWSFAAGGAVATLALIGGQIAAALILKSFILRASRWLSREWRKVATGES